MFKGFLKNREGDPLLAPKQFFFPGFFWVAELGWGEGTWEIWLPFFESRVFPQQPGWLTWIFQPACATREFVWRGFCVLTWASSGSFRSSTSILRKRWACAILSQDGGAAQKPRPPGYPPPASPGMKRRSSSIVTPFVSTCPFLPSCYLELLWNLLSDTKCPGKSTGTTTRGKTISWSAIATSWLCPRSVSIAWCTLFELIQQGAFTGCSHKFQFIIWP